MKGKNQIKVEVKEMPKLHVAYVRHIGPYKGDSELFERLFGNLMKWAGPRGLLRFPETKVLAVYHDDPKITDEDKLRTSACITIPGDTPVEGEETTPDTQLVDKTYIIPLSFATQKETVRVEMIQNGVTTTVYEKEHDKSEENVRVVVSGNGEATVNFYFGSLKVKSMQVTFN